MPDKALQAALALFHQLGGKTAMAVSRYDQVERPRRCLHALLARAVAGVAIHTAVAHVWGITEMHRQLRVQRSLYEPRGQVLEQSVLTENVLR